MRRKQGQVVRCPGEVSGGQLVIGLEINPRGLDSTSQAIRSRRASDIITIRFIRKVTGSCEHDSREWAFIGVRSQDRYEGGRYKVKRVPESPEMQIPIPLMQYFLTTQN